MKIFQAIIENPFFWLALSATLLFLEVIGPTQVALGFAMGAFIVSIGLYFDISWLSGTLILLLSWICSSLFSWIVLRLFFKNRATRSSIEKGDINEYD